MSKPRVIHDFATVLGLLSRGRLLERLDEKLAEALAALDRTPDEKTKAQITLTIELVRVQERVELKPVVKLKLPDEKGLPSSTLFAFEDGLSLEHPQQLDMFGGPRPVDKTAADRG